MICYAEKQSCITTSVVQCYSYKNDRTVVQFSSQLFNCLLLYININMITDESNGRTLFCVVRVGYNGSPLLHFDYILGWRLQANGLRKYFTIHAMRAEQDNNGRVFQVLETGR